MLFDWTPHPRPLPTPRGEEKMVTFIVYWRRFVMSPKTKDCHEYIT